MFFALCLAFIASVAAFSTNTTNRISKRDSDFFFIGYRAVDAYQASLYAANEGSIVWDGPGPDPGGDQLGEGIYLSFNLGDWTNEYFCAFLANKDAWDDVQKIFVPEAWNGQVYPTVEATPDNDECYIQLWWDDDYDDRSAYLRTVGGNGYNVDNTVLISVIDQGLFGIEQFLIPPGLAPPNNPLGLQAWCTSVENPDLVYAIADEYGNVDWRSEYKNVAGMQWAPPPPPTPPRRPVDLENLKLKDFYDAIPGSRPPGED